MLSPQNLVVIITGASSGIGAEVAYQLGKQGAKLVLAARGESALAQVATHCRAVGAQVLTVKTDVALEADCQRLIAQALEAFGRIDVLINNAGISMWARLDEVADLEAMRQIMGVNYFGSVYCTRYALPHLMASKGRIVGVASLAGVTGVPTRTFYAASKHAMMGFFDSLRIELLGSGVSVTMVCPGFVATEIMRLDSQGARADNELVKSKKVMPVNVCAQSLIKAMLERKRELLMTRRGKIGRFLKLIAPRLVDKLAQNAIKQGY